VEDYQRAIESLSKKIRTRVESFDEPITEAEYSSAKSLLCFLLKSASFSELRGEVVQNEFGECLVVTNSIGLSVPKPHPNQVKQKILGDLQLLRGVRQKRELEFRMRGCHTITDLLYHKQFQNEAIKIVEAIKAEDHNALFESVVKRHSFSHEMAIKVSSLFEEKVVFLDIETLGLFNRPIILIGIAKTNDELLSIRQIVARDVMEEAAVLSEFLRSLDENTLFVSFNGRRFDEPYIKERLAYYGLPFVQQRPHIDLLYCVKRLKGIERTRLVSLEKALLGITRRVDVPSALVPEFYKAYIETRNPAPLVAILEHNKQDLLSLALLYRTLSLS
jgi:uncharacterized protein YprB with RNaseH-like and TPR domain